MYDVLKYIHSHIDEHLYATDVAKKFGFSKWYFCDCFKRFTGTTFVEYTRHYRMQLASLEILDNKKIIDIAIKYGYDTQSGFDKAFLREFGCLPTAFVKQNKLFHIEYKEKRDKMMKISDRCAILRDDAVIKKSINHRICAQRQLYYTHGLHAFDKSDEIKLYTRAAQAIVSVIEGFKPIIIEGELIVGYNFGDADTSECWAPANTENDMKILEENGFSHDEVNRYFYEISIPIIYPSSSPMLSRRDTETELEWCAKGCCCSSNHSVIGYEQVLQLGFEGIYKRIEKYEKQNGSSDFYNGMKMLCKKAELIGEKYANEARSMQADPLISDVRRAELKKIEEVCLNVPKKPATCFYEAVQALWFAHIINTWEDYINANSLGRLDQILYPYYHHDIDNGIITKEQAFELICCLWIKLYRDYDVQQSCIGGCKKDGTDAVNELSYLMLDATEEMDFVRCLSVRFSQNTDKAFLMRALEVVGHIQKGIPFFFNDDVMIPALMSKSISLEDARDYTQIGCVETVIPGKSNPHAVSGQTNLLKALEYVFGNGHSLMNPEFEPGLKTGEISKFKTYDAFEKAVFKQIENLLDSSCRKVSLYTKVEETNSPKPYKSLLTEGCIEKGLDFNNHGAKYDYYQVMLGGIPNLADSLEVIRKFVFIEKRYSLQFLSDQIKNNFPDEAFRQECLHKAPKFGNDIDEVDEIAVNITNYACDVLEELSKKYEMSFHAQPFTFLWMVDQGHVSAASPDGRKNGEILAYSASPMQGRDFNGFTALLNSISKFPTKRTPGTTSAIVEVDPKLFTDNNIEHFADIVFAAAEKGLCNAQFNVIDAETLIDAQQHPEKYENLAVRVSGFSQKFNLLNPDLQNHIIERTKHKCL